MMSSILLRRLVRANLGLPNQCFLPHIASRIPATHVSCSDGAARQPEPQQCWARSHDWLPIPSTNTNDAVQGTPARRERKSVFNNFSPPWHGPHLQQHAHQSGIYTQPFPYRQTAATLASPPDRILPTSGIRQLKTSTSSHPGRLLVVQPRSRGYEDLQEALRLAETYSGSQEVPHLEVGSSKRRAQPVASTYFGSGTVDTIRQQCLLLPDVTAVFVNASLTAVQERNLSAQLGMRVLDRVQLIISIFAQRARSKEARLQVELASLNHQLSRLVRITTKAGRAGFGADGQQEVVSGRQRAGGRGMGGGGGPGETELALQRSRIVRKRAALERSIEEVRKHRMVQRKSRQTAGVPVVAVVGYTNAGKSTLVNALTKSTIYAEDQLFATLDPTARRLVLPNGQACILTDTVGFIRDLPLKLVQAFRATLEEVLQADLLLHVLDASSPAVLQQRADTLRVLRQLGLGPARLGPGLLEVWNKVDVVGGWQQAQRQLRLRDVGDEQQEREQNEGACSEDGGESRRPLFERDGDDVWDGDDEAMQDDDASGGEEQGCKPRARPDVHSSSWLVDSEPSVPAGGRLGLEQSTAPCVPSREVLKLLRIAGGSKAAEEYATAAEDLPGSAVLVSAATGHGLPRLHEVLQQLLTVHHKSHL